MTLDLCPQAIDALEAATRVKPVPPLFLLLGKTQMKAQMWKKAIQSFEKALELVVGDNRSVYTHVAMWEGFCVNAVGT